MLDICYLKYGTTIEKEFENGEWDCTEGVSD